ncbi:MAG: hypothetical protein NTW14_12165 [bacterium]|nr:hypothetical protein [bacterium]
MKEQNEDLIELKVDGKTVKLNPYVRSVVKQVNLGILRTLDLPVKSPRQYELNIKLNLPEEFK